jgi:hypothetical protein
VEVSRHVALIVIVPAHGWAAHPIGNRPDHLDELPVAFLVESERTRHDKNDGALLRLRPKVMTVATTIAALLPIMWSTSAGAEVMKPLATPVLGGMVSSLLHVLIVTPVIFFWLHERALKRQERDVAAAAGLRRDEEAG